MFQQVENRRQREVTYCIHAFLHYLVVLPGGLMPTPEGVQTYPIFTLAFIRLGSHLVFARLRGSHGVDVYDAAFGAAPSP